MIDSTQPRVAYQGAPGAFGQEAVDRYWGGRALPVEEPTFDDVVAAVSTGSTEYAVLPVWNSTIGQIDAAWAALDRCPHASRGLRMIGELTLGVRHYVMTRPCTRYSDIRYVVAHPATLAQCARYIGEHKLRAVGATDSAAAARALAAVSPDVPFSPPGCELALDPRTTAVIAPAAAAARYGLAVLAAAVQNDPDNRTSFLVIKGGQNGGVRW